jgi:hypothetical protein
VIWPDAQITHYLAGDAPVALEEGVMQWTGMGASQSDKSQVHVVKASNHGARTSFPLTLCQKFKPSYILCSAGKGHEYPSKLIQSSLSRIILISSHLDWEFMFKVYSSMATNWDMMNCRIFFTNFPYYLRDGYKGGFKVDAKSLEEGAFYESFSSALKKYDSKTDPVKWVRSVLAQIILPQFARINDDFPPMEAANAHDDIQFIVIQSPAGDRPWSARVERLTSKRWAVTSKSSATVASKSSATVASKSSATVDAPLYTALSSPSYATPPGHAALATPDIVFYVTSSSVAVPPGPYAKVDAKWDAFIGALSSGYLVLSSKPPTTLAEVKLEMNDDFINVDQWLLWLTNLLHGEVDLSVLASLNDPNPVAIGCFKLSVTLQIGKDPISLTFNPSVTVGPDLGQKFDPYKHFLHFCLPESKPSTITLSDLFSFYNISEEAVWFKSDLAFDLVTDHCAVWLSAMLGSYSGTFRLEASTKANLSEFSDSLKEMGLWNVIPKSITVVVKRSIARFEFEDGGHPDAVSQLGFALEFEDFKAIMFCSSESYLIAFRWQKGAEDALENILKTKASGYKPGSFKDILGKISSFDILGASVEIKKKSPSGFEVARIIVDVEITFTYGSGSGSNNKGASFLLTFAYPQFLFRASLYTTDGTGEIWRKDMPDYEPLLEVTPTRKPNENISILELFPDLDNSALPHSIPHEIKQATFQIDDSTISFSGTLESKSVGTGDIPTISFDTLELDASCCLAAHPSWSLSIAVTVRLHPGHGAGFSRSNADEGTGVLYASVDYDSTTGKWKLSGGLSNIKFSDLLMFFHEKERDQVEEILGSISIPSIFLSYEYEKGMPSRFQFDGSIAIGKIEMQLKYVRDKDGWQVDATLTASAQYTLMDLLVEICGRTIEEELPDFFEEISLTPETMHLTCAKNSKSPPNSALVTSFDVMYKVGDIGKLSFTLVQISYPKERSGMKRRRLLSLGFTDLLPSLKMNVPLFGSLNNPIDGLELFWVNNLGGPSTASGLTREQIMEINGGIGTPIRFKETKASQSPKDVLITAGCHFMLLVNDSGTAQVCQCGPTKIWSLSLLRCLGCP